VVGNFDQDIRRANRYAGEHGGDRSEENIKYFAILLGEQVCCCSKSSQEVDLKKGTHSEKD
jgi:hypothetical protein